jgi:lipopolysaccharide biosynthesis glycosyltransferase
MLFFLSKWFPLGVHKRKIGKIFNLCLKFWLKVNLERLRIYEIPNFFSLSYTHFCGQNSAWPAWTSARAKKRGNPATPPQYWSQIYLERDSSDQSDAIEKVAKNLSNEAKQLFVSQIRTSENTVKCAIVIG